MRRNLRTNGTDLVELADNLLARLDSALQPNSMIGHNLPLEQIDDANARAAFDTLRHDLQGFRDALASAVAAPQGDAEAVIHHGARLGGAIKAVADHPIGRATGLGFASLGICYLAQRIGIDINATLALIAFVAGADGVKAAADIARRIDD